METNYTISHREYVGDILTSASNTNSLSAFQLQSWYINPGNSYLHPWFSAVCSGNWNNFRYRKLRFIFVSTSSTSLSSTNTALGLVMGKVYKDPTYVPDTSEIQILNSYGAHKANPSQSWYMDVDCNDPLSAMGTITQFTTPAALPSSYDPRFYFPNGFFELATIGMQANSVNIGQLYLEFTCTLYSQIYQAGEIGNTIRTAHYQLTAPSSTYALGTAQTSKGDYIGLTFTTPTTCNVVSFPVSVTTGTYLLIWDSVGTNSTGACQGPSIAITNGSIVTAFTAAVTTPTSSIGNYLIPSSVNPESATRVSSQIIFTVSAPGVSQCTITFTPSTIPTGTPAGDLWITQINGLITS